MSDTIAGAAIVWRLAQAMPSSSAPAAPSMRRRRRPNSGHGLRGLSNADAAVVADLVIVTLPFAAQDIDARRDPAACRRKDGR